VIVTLLPALAMTPPVGDCETTSPAGVRLDSSTITTTNPASPSVWTASA